MQPSDQEAQFNEIINKYGKDAWKFAEWWYSRIFPRGNPQAKDHEDYLHDSLFKLRKHVHKIGTSYKDPRSYWFVIIKRLMLADARKSNKVVLGENLEQWAIARTEEDIEQQVLSDKTRSLFLRASVCPGGAGAVGREFLRERMNPQDVIHRERVAAVLGLALPTVSKYWYRFSKFINSATHTIPYSPQVNESRFKEVLKFYWQEHRTFKHYKELEKSIERAFSVSTCEAEGLSLAAWAMRLFALQKYFPQSNSTMFTVETLHIAAKAWWTLIVLQHPVRKMAESCILRLLVNAEQFDPTDEMCERLAERCQYAEFTRSVLLLDQYSADK